MDKTWKQALIQALRGDKFNYNHLVQVFCDKLKDYIMFRDTN